MQPILRDLFAISLASTRVEAGRAGAAQLHEVAQSRAADVKVQPASLK